MCAILPKFRHAARAGSLLVAAVAVAASSAEATPSSRSTFDAGAYHACALSAGQLACWGFNKEGELGLGDSVDRLLPTKVTTLPAPVAQVAASYNRTCALTTTGRVFCWGRGAKLKSGKSSASSTPRQVPGTPSGIVDLSVGVDHACVRTVPGEVWCWGEDDRGQLGDAKTKASASPVKARVAGVTQVA